MPGIEDFTAWYSALPTPAKIGIPVVGVGAVAFVALYKKGSTTGSAVTGPTVDTGASSGGGGGGGGSGSSSGSDTAVPPPAYLGPPTPAPVPSPYPGNGGGGTPGPVGTNGYGNSAANTPGTPQYNALQNPNSPYTDTSISGGATFTPNQARQWWADWFANPVNLSTVNPALLPGSLVLTSDQLSLAQKMQAPGTTLPAGPSDYNPLGLPITTGYQTLASGAQVSGQNPNNMNSGGVIPSAAASGGTTGANKPGPTIPTAAESAALPQLNKYIANLSAVKNPTAAQKTELATYKARAVAYGG